FRSDVAFNRPLRAFFQNLIQICSGCANPAGLAGAGGDIAKQLVNQFTQFWTDFLHSEIAAQKTNATVDVETNSTGGYDSVLLIPRRYAADWQSITLMDVRHGERTTHDAGHHCNVRRLFE